MYSVVGATCTTSTPNGARTSDADQAFGFGTRLRFARFVELRATYFRDATADTEPDSLPPLGSKLFSLSFQ